MDKFASVCDLWAVAVIITEFSTIAFLLGLFCLPGCYAGYKIAKAKIHAG